MFLRCRRGVVALEFALVASIFFVLVFIIVEVAWQLTTASILDRAALRASRFGITGQARLAGAPVAVTCRSQSIPWVMTSSTNGFLKSSNLTVLTGFVPNLEGMFGRATTGAGGGEQVVTYRVRYRQPFISSNLLSIFGAPDHVDHDATVVVKNEPFDNVVC